MKKIKGYGRGHKATLWLLMVVLCTACSYTVPVSVPEPAYTVAENQGVHSVLDFIEYLTKGEISAPYPKTDTEIHTDALYRRLDLILFARGPILAYRLEETPKDNGTILFDIYATHETGAAVYCVVVHGNGDIGDFFKEMERFTPHPAPDAPPPFYTAEAIVIGAETPWALNGILTLPDGAHEGNPVPGVVLVHGSGPHDKDVRIQGTRIFFDIADYLSENGIAVLRYDKRTFAHRRAFEETFGSGATVWEETVEDAVLAAEQLRADPRIHTVYMLGWSFGGMLAPRIHASGGHFDGLIFLAGSPRPFIRVMIDQLAATEHDEGLQDLIRTADVISAMTDDEAKKTRLPLLDTYAFYIKEMDSHPFERYIEDLHVPVLVMQGLNDYQILADVDYPRMGELFGVRDDATFKLYKDTDHFFMPSIAGNASEYRDSLALRPPGTRVNPLVLRDIAEWIFSLE